MARSQEHHSLPSKHVHRLTSSRGSDFQLRRRLGLIKVVRVKLCPYHGGQKWKQRGEARKRNSKTDQAGDRGSLIDLPHPLWQWFMPTVEKTRIVSRSNVSQLVFLSTPFYSLSLVSSLLLSYTQPSSVVPFSAGIYLSIWTSFHRWQAPAWCSSWQRERGVCPTALTLISLYYTQGKSRGGPLPAGLSILLFLQEEKYKAAVFCIAHLDSVFNRHNSNVIACTYDTKYCSRTAPSISWMSQHAVRYIHE